MATLDDSPSLFAGQPWTAWEEKIKSKGEDDSVKPKRVNCDDTETVKLRKEDKPLFGLCPAQDQCYLVVCEKCGQVVKPQALKKHTEQRHGVKLPLAPVRAVTPTAGALKSSTPPPSRNKSPVSANASVSPGPGSKSKSLTSAPSKYGNSSSSGKAAKPPPPSTSKIKQLVALSQIKSDPVVKVEPLDQSVVNQYSPTPEAVTTKTFVDTKPVVTKSLSSPSVSLTKTMLPVTTVPLLSPVTTTTTVTASSSISTPTKTNLIRSNSSSSSAGSGSSKKLVKERKFLPCKDREFDPDRHCGVWIPEIRKQCTRSLTCKTHALSLRRAVQDRSKSFDELLREHRAAKEALLQAKQAAAGMVAAKKSSNSGGSSGIKAEPSRRQSVNSESSLKGSAGSHHAIAATALPLGPKLPTKPSSHRLPNSFLRQNSQSAKEAAPPPEQFQRICSDCEEDGDKVMMEVPYISTHPQPAAVNHFGARIFTNDASGRLQGPGCYVFSRKFDFARAVVRSTLEKHLQPCKTEPPVKKRCVEAKLPKDPQHVSTASKDPYDFNILESTAAGRMAHTGSSSAAGRVVHTGSSSAKSKSNSAANKNSNGHSSHNNNNNKSKDSNITTMRSLGGDGGNSNHSSNQKRKRSGSRDTSVHNMLPASSVAPSAVAASTAPTVPTAGAGQFTHITGGILLNSGGSSVPLAIPAGFSLNLAGANIGNLTMAQSANRQLVKNFVVANIDGSGFANGQLVSFSSNDQLQGGTTITTSPHQQNGIVDGQQQLQHGAKAVIGLNAKKPPPQGVGGGGGFLPRGVPALNSLPASGLANTTVLIDANAPLNAILTPVAVTGGNLIAGAAANPVNTTGVSITSPQQSSPATTPSPNLRAGSVSPPVGSPLPNGIIPSPSAASSKGFTLNHLTASMALSPVGHNSSPSPSSSSVSDTGGGNKGKTSSNPTGRFNINDKTRFNVTYQKSLQQAQQQAALATGAGNKKLNNYQQVYPGLQQHAGQLRGLSGKQKVNPMNLQHLSLPLSSSQQQPLFLSDDHHKQQIQPQMQHSPSGMIS
ncbi:ataxin-7 [Lingula anatina]|uniref:Ataxin-7 n=1 Tax=Lingula anatina TaxID=7574 RepID=A0A1S3JW67_LINAN|nr:ataxin-7 [Lingula anatina]|eukprot:XP_013414670.1 ataxin-7 [Lingula anatina]